MNFLLHRALATTESQDRLVGLGAMLPDLWRMAHRRVRAKQQALEDQPLEPGARVENRLLRGVAHHLEADRWFHKAEVFTQGERTTAQRLRSIGSAKLGLFGHIAWELCLDGAWLLSQPDFQEVSRTIAIDAEKAGAGMWQLATTFGSERLGDELPRFKQRLQRIVFALSATDWLVSYTHGAGLRDRVAGLRRHLGLPALTIAQAGALAQALDQSLKDARTELPRLYEARHHALA